MPWNHCGHDILDDTSCPDCGLSKAEWTVVLDKTRVFQISPRSKKDALKIRLWDSQQAEIIPEEPFSILTLDGSKTLLESQLDEEGYAAVLAKDLDGEKVVLLQFTERGTSSVGPLSSSPPLQPTPGRFAVVTKQLYEFRLVGIFLSAAAEPTENPQLTHRAKGETTPGPTLTHRARGRSKSSPVLTHRAKSQTTTTPALTHRARSTSTQNAPLIHSART